MHRPYLLISSLSMSMTVKITLAVKIKSLFHSIWNLQTRNMLSLIVIITILSQASSSQTNELACPEGWERLDSKCHLESCKTRLSWEWRQTGSANGQSRKWWNLWFVREMGKNHQTILDRTRNGLSLDVMWWRIICSICWNQYPKRYHRRLRGILPDHCKLWSKYAFNLIITI